MAVTGDSEIIDNEDKKHRRNMNKTAFYSLTASMTTQVNKDLIFESKTHLLKRGDAKLSWENLQKKYAIDNSKTETELQNKFLNCILTSKEHPSDWLARMDKMRNAICKTKSMNISEKGFRERLIKNLPAKKYQMLKLNLLTLNDNNLTTDECKKQIINYHSIIKSNSFSEIDIALNTFNINQDSQKTYPTPTSNNINDQEL